MQSIIGANSNERPEDVIVTDQYVDENENIREETYFDDMSGLAKTRFVYDVKRYSVPEFIAKLRDNQPTDIADIRLAFLELTDIVMSGGIN